MRASQVEKTITKAEATKRISEKAARAEKAAKIWDNHPLFKGELSKLKEAKARQNAAIHLTNQARFMKQLNEQETSAEFQRMAPAHIMRLVQLTMTNLNRGNVFSEYAMETARDAIYYIKPYFSKSVAPGAGNFATRSMDYGNPDAEGDPFGFGKDVEETTLGGYNGKDNYYGGAKHARNGSESKLNARKSIYESAESRFANELANATKIETAENGVKITWTDNEFGTKGENYIPGSTKIYKGTNEQAVIAFQDPNTFGYYIGQEYTDIVKSVTDDGNVTTIEFKTGVSEDDKFQAKDINAYARFESENDIEGKHIGEVNLFMSVYELRPRRTSIGVSWTKLAEITLDSTFNTQVDDLLLSSAADVIHGQLDLQAFKDAYAISKTNPKSYCIEFDAKGKVTDVPTTEDGQKAMFTYSLDSYVATANTFASAIELAGAALYTDIKRGAINKLVVGVSVAPYLKLMAGFAPTGLQTPAGVYKIGELDGIEVYKAPVEVIPHDEVLCVFKNEKVENDVALVYGTLVPFVSSKLEYPTFYTRAGLASFGDKAILNPKYLARIVVKNLKDELKLDA